MATQEFYQPYSETLSPGQYAIYPLSGYNLSLYNTYGTVVPYYIPLVTNTASIPLKANETVVFEIDYCIPALQDAPKYTSSKVYNPITNPMIDIAVDNIPYKSGASGKPQQWYGVPGTISSVGGEYPLIMNASSDSAYETYSAMNQQSLHLFIVKAESGDWHDDDILDSNKVLRIQQLPLIENGTGQISYNTTEGVNVRAVLVYKGSLVWRNSYKTVLFKDFKISKYKQVTQVSDKGLLVFNNPAQYIKFTAVGSNGATKSEAVMAIDTLYARKVYADSYYGGNVGGEDKGGGTAGAGGGTVEELTYYGGEQPYLQSSVTFSAPAFSGSGFTLPDNYKPTTAFGHYPAGSQLLKGKNLLQAIQSAFMYQSPSISRVGNAPSITWGNATDKFITTAMNATKTWGQQYQLPAKFATTTVSVTYSGVSWTYNNQQNIDLSTIEGAYLTSSIASNGGTVQAHTVLPATYFSSSEGLVTSRGPVTYSVKFAKVDTVPSSRNQSATLTPKQEWIGVKDTLQNAIAAPGLIANASTKTTNNLGRYGSRFMVVRRKSDDSGVQWRACTSTGTIPPTSGWVSYAQAFTKSTPFLGSATEIQKTLTMHSSLYDGTNGDRPVSLVLLAPASCVIYSTANTRGLWGQGEARLSCYTFNTVANTPSNGLMNYDDAKDAAFNLTGIDTEGDPATAFNSAATGFTKTWPIGLTSTMKLFIIRTLTQPRTANWTMTWYAN